MGLALAFGASATINFSASDIQYWVGTGSNSAVVVIAWDDYTTPTAYAWGVHWNGNASALDLVDSIQAYDSRFSNGSTATVASATYTENGVTLTSESDYWCYTVNGQWATVGYTGYTMSNGDIMEISGSCGFSMTSAVAATDPNTTTTPVEATIDFSDILYWVGTGSNEAVLAVNWADTALAWGYRWNGTATVATMMADIAAADTRFSYDAASGWLNDITFNDGTVSLAGTPGNYWGSTNNGIMDAGMGQTLSDGDFEKLGDPAAGVIVDSMEYSGFWYYTYVYPMTVHPVSVPATTPETPEEATIDFGDILYWVGTGSNEAVLAVNWPDTALAWGYRWNGNATVADMLNAVNTADPRFTFVPGGYGVDDLLFVENGDTLRKVEYSWWGSTNNGVTDMGVSQTLNNGDLEKWADGTTGVLVDSTWVTDWGGYWDYTYVYPMTIHPVSVPEIAAEDATIAAEDIRYWIGEGENEAIFVVNWATKAYAWGYRFAGESVNMAAMMDDIAAADERFAYTMNSGFLSDITYTDGSESLAGTPGNFWEVSIDGDGNVSMASYLADGAFVRWADPAAGVVADSFYYEGYGWFYSYVYPMAITPVEPAYVAGPFCGIVGSEGCNAIAADSNVFVGWATTCTLELGPQNISVPGSPLVSYHDASDAIGPCNTTDNLSVVSLGDGGSATLTFAQPIADGPGPDFAVFENSWGDYFLELAFVEVSSDGERFVRFPATSLTQTDVQITGSVDPTFINNLAGKFRMGYGTPFDLNELRDSTGIDINNITHVRVVDVVGSIDPQYGTYDAFGHIINDPWPTDSYSGGFDLDGVGVINVAGEQGIDDVAADGLQLNVWPNPATDVVMVNTTNAGDAELYDFSGRLVATYTIAEGSNTINVADLPAGVYMLRASGIVKKLTVIK